ncbi:pirin family protein [Vibrio methylphosphonaticus]|uniref:pirin family protein n=1 Tax=Vibrio methylphosphonaticus TaxID=2946866 RepID=UPI002029D0C3|nr:pirin family protein [Vibrio methylphosphonaticus]MCL9773890.1 pirin family protein [Vibrio methylphosphonaticus]
MTVYRNVQHIIPSHATSDGDGVKIRRVHGFDNQAFSPFLMIDELRSDDKKDYIGGFPPHPHRGIETLTYMRQGHFQHRDHMGNVGELRSGGAQWMAAGQGVIHSEMPIMEEGALHGFQIWINQPANNKMIPAQYHDYQPETITQRTNEDMGSIRIIAGELGLNDAIAAGPLQKTGVPLMVADWQTTHDQRIKLRLDANHNAMVYVYLGQASIEGKMLQQGELALLSKGDLLKLSATGESGMLIFSGEPIDEPIVHYGPFVMNSKEEIQQAIDDYNAGLFETY